MIQGLIICAFFAFIYALKGGSGNVFPWWNKLRATNAITERLMDGKVISTLGVLVFMTLATGQLVCDSCGDFGVPVYELKLFYFMGSIAFAAAWLLSVAPSMGEEHGAIGRIGKAWGEYIDKGFGRSYGIKKGIQRGVWMGALMTLVTGFVPYIYFSFLFVPAVFIGQQLSWWIFRRDGWALAEPIIGGLVFGVPTALWLLG